ncbi:MAG: AAA family ATPase [Clostridia bacterium]|nr:AAA family ATPase [Clostridia bacterium]
MFELYLLTIYSLSVDQAQVVTVGSYFHFSPEEYEKEKEIANDTMHRYAYEEFLQFRTDLNLIKSPEPDSLPLSSELTDIPDALAEPESQIVSDEKETIIAQQYGMTHWMGNMETPDPLPQIWGDVIEVGGRLQLVGASKMGKTWLAMGLLSCIAQGVPFLDLPTTQTDVLFVNPELDDISYRRRLSTVRDGYLGELPLFVKSDVGKHFYETSLRNETETMTHLVDRILKASKATGKKWGLVFIDSVYLFLQGDENTLDAWNAFLREVTRLSTGLGGASVWWSHHPPKGDYSGKDILDVSSGHGSKERFIDTCIVMRLLRVPQSVRAKYNWKPKDVGILIEFSCRNEDHPDSIRVRFSEGKFTRADEALKDCPLRRGPQDDVEKKRRPGEKFVPAKPEAAEEIPCLDQTRLTAIRAIFKAQGKFELSTETLLNEMAARVEFKGVGKDSLRETLRRLIKAYPSFLVSPRRGFYKLLAK